MLKRNCLRLLVLSLMVLSNGSNASAIALSHTPSLDEWIDTNPQELVDEEEKQKSNPTPRILTEIYSEMSWAREVNEAYGYPKLEPYYKSAITFPEDGNELGPNEGDFIEGYIDLPIYMISLTGGATMYHGIKFGHTPDVAFNKVDFVFSGYDNSAYEIKIDESKTIIPSTHGVKLPTSKGANIGNKARYFIQITRIKKTSDTVLKIPTDLTWRTHQNYDNGIWDTKYYRGWSKTFKNTYTINLKSEPTLETKDSAIYQGQEYDASNNYVTGFDLEGNEIKWGDEGLVVEGDYVNTNVPGIYKQNLVYNYNNSQKVSSEYTVEVKEDQTKMQLKDAELYVEETFDINSTFENVQDKDGDKLTPDKIRYYYLDGVMYDGEAAFLKNIDTTNPRKYDMQIAFMNAASTSYIYSEIVTITIKEDQTKMELKDTELYVGEKFDINSTFKNVQDKEGNRLSPDKIRYYYLDGVMYDGDAAFLKNIDTTEPRKYDMQIAFMNAASTSYIYSEIVTINIKEDQTSIVAKDITYYVGEKYNPEDAFIAATDKDGNSLGFDKSMHAIDSDNPVDTSKPGTYFVWYGIEKASGTMYEVQRSVFVKERELVLSVPENISFGNTVLGKGKKLYWDKKSEVSIDNLGNRKWDLTARLETTSNQDFFDYLKFEDQSFKEGAVLIDSGNSSKTITNELIEEKFIHVDYSSVGEIREDKATLEWTLSPSTKEVKE